MNSKVTTQMMADRLSNSANVNKKVAEAFLRAFSETILEGVVADGSVKVNGIGSFKIVAVADRASVDVNTGERIIIAGYDKLNFASDEELNDRLNGKEQVSPTVSKAVIDRKKNKSTVNKTTKIAESEQQKELPAKIETSVHVVMAEESVKPVGMPSQVETVLSVVADSNQVNDSARVAETIVTEKIENETQSPFMTALKKVTWWRYVGFVVSVAIICVIVLLVHNNSSKQSTKPVETEQSVKLKKKVSKPTQEKVAKQTVTKVHILKKGESLITLSVLYYNTPDSMEAICKFNNIRNPHILPPGTVIKLP